MEGSTKSSTRKRSRRSRKEWRSLVSRFEESGQTREAFCAAVDLDRVSPRHLDDLRAGLEGEEVAAWLNSIGVTGIILKYRVPRRPRFRQNRTSRPSSSTRFAARSADRAT